MSTETTNTIQVTLVHPKGTIKLTVPIDLPLGELMPDFLDVAQQPDRDGWELGPAAGEPYREQDKTLAELGVGGGTVLVLHEPTKSAVAVGEHAVQKNDAARVTAPRREDVYGSARQRTIPSWLKTRRQRYEESLDQRLAAVAGRITRTNVVAVIGPQGGPGKTRVAYALGAAVAWHTRLNVIVVDVDDDYGALPDLLADEVRSPRTLADLLERDETPPLPVLRRYVSATPSGMLVLAGPHEPQRMRELHAADFDRLLRLLAGADVVILDCAAGLTRERAAWAISSSDQRVVVARPEFTGATTTARALRDSVPVAGTTLVLNKVAERRQAAVDPIRQVFATAGLDDPVEIPHSALFAARLERATYRLRDMPRRVRVPIKELAVGVGEEFR
jgi:MinD-like ATPase involved in chromosome partitioning or flagellar assembly